MASESCPVCGEEADANEIDPHGHFSIEDGPCSVCGEFSEDHYVIGAEADHDFVAEV